MRTFTRNYSHQHYRRLTVPRRKKKTFLYIKLTAAGICLVIIILVSKNAFTNSHNEPEPAAGQALAAKHEPANEAQEPPKRQVDTSKLKADLDQIINQYPYNISVSVIDLNSDTLVQAGDEKPFIAASTTKLITALLYLDNVEAGQDNLDTLISGKPAREQLELAIKQSDNNAWHRLDSHLGKANLTAYTQKHKLTSYDYSSNTITSNDMALLTAKLYKRELLNEEHTKLLLSWMQNTSEERFIPAAVPAGVPVYHKAGYLAERVHDVAVIDNGSAPFAIVIYSKSYTASYDYLLGQEMFRQVTEHVMATFK